LSNREKLIQRLLARPSDMRFAELDRVLCSFGYELKGGKGSHRRYECPGRSRIVVPVSSGRVKRVCLDWFVKLLGLEDENGRG
jgi:predicted RNA binding protein YcfA (HicA-like mRNA interferase family)